MEKNIANKRNLVLEAMNTEFYNGLSESAIMTDYNTLQEYARKVVNTVYFNCFDLTNEVIIRRIANVINGIAEQMRLNRISIGEGETSEVVTLNDKMNSLLAEEFNIQTRKASKN